MEQVLQPSPGTRFSKPLQLAVLFGLFALARLALFLKLGYTADDALITFRYAQHVASGGGFVYNIGDHVLGTTTPLLTLIVAALSFLHLNGFWSAFLVNTGADICTAYVMLKLFAGRPWHWAPAAVFLIGPESLQWGLSGMETELSIALLFGALLLAGRNRWTAALAVSGVAVLNRVDGIAVAGAIFVACLVRERKIPWRGIAAAIGVLLPWLVFATLYFGSPFPNSAAAKIALSAGPGGAHPGAFLSTLFIGFLHFQSFGVPLFVLALAGTVTIGREARGWLALPVWTWCYAVAYSAASGPMHPWYYAPFYAGYIALAFAGLFAAVRRFHPGRTVPAIGAAAIIVVLILSYYRVMEIRTVQARMDSVNRQAGLWLKSHTTPNAVVACKDIGYIGYYSERPILDLAGLVSPECISFRARNDFLGPIRTFRPDYFAFSEGQVANLNLETSDLMRIYEKGADIGSYRIYKKKDARSRMQNPG